MRHEINLKGGFIAALLVAGVAGCGGAAVPHEKVASAQSAIRAAEEVGAQREPQAQLHLKLARDQVAQAKALIEDDENERARMLLMRAEADAELALALAKESALRNEARQAVEQVRLVRQRTP